MEFLKIKNTISKIKNSRNGLKGRLDNAEETISEFRDVTTDPTQTEVLEEK